MQLGKFMKQERKGVFVKTVCFSFNVYSFLSLQLQNRVLLSLKVFQSDSKKLITKCSRRKEAKTIHFIEKAL